MEIKNISDYTILNNGIKMPRLGLGVFKMNKPGEAENAVKYALEAGYKSIDTASIYKNEEEVAKGIKKSGVNRENIFLTTKVWNEDLRADNVKGAFEESLKRLNTDYIDLYLIHWPVKECYKKAWEILEEIYKKGQIRAIGVSNFMVEHLDDLLATTDIIPTVNQIEYHPYLVQPELINYCKSKKIQVEAWSPLIQGKIFSIEAIKNLAKKYEKNPVQIVLRWNLQNSIVTIPKSSRKDRIVDNTRIYDFKLSDDDMALINSLDKNSRVGPNPYNFNF